MPGLSVEQPSAASCSGDGKLKRGKGAHMRRPDERVVNERWWLWDGPLKIGTGGKRAI